VDAAHDSVEVPVPLAVRVILVELNELQVKPAGTTSVRSTEPAKFNVLVRVMVEEINEPGTPLGEVAEIEKSPT
jgi:hypothetical protein